MRSRKIAERISNLKLRTKVLLTFWCISLIPLGILATLNRATTIQVLTRASYKSLSAASVHAAGTIDSFLSSNLEFIGTEAALPALSQLVVASSSGTPDPRLARAAQEALSSFASKNRIFALSVGLLDVHGVNLADTVAARIGQRESDRSYFTGALRTNIPFVSPVELEPDGAAVLCFSSPLHGAGGGPIGVLRTCYNARVLQQVVVKQTGQLGEQSFGILVDEKGLILAYGGASLPLADKILFHSVRSSLVPSGLSKIVDNPSIVFPAVISANFVVGSQTPDAGAITPLHYQPWTMVFVQPESVFLAPILVYATRTMLIAALAALATGTFGLLAAGILTAPILKLAAVSQRIAKGDLTARAPVQGGRELRLLSTAFNEMVHQIEQREKNLAHANEQLRESEEQFRATFELAAVGKAQVAPETGRFLRVNTKFCEMTGYSPEELRNMTFREITHPDDIEGDAVLFQRLVRGEVPMFDRVERYIRKDREVIWVRATAALIRDKNGRPVSTTGVFQDITDQKRAEEERDQLLIREKQARAEAEQALRAREEFMAIASHELRTPLTPLKMQHYILRKILTKEPSLTALKGQHDLLKIFEASEQQLNRLAMLVEDLLDAPRISLGHLILHPEETDLSELARGVLERCQSQLKQARCAVELQAEKKVIGQWDRLRIEQVLINLLANAIKYGAGTPIEVTVCREGDHAKIVVRDHGIGIAEGDQKRIFDCFERAVSVRHFGGFGLGLYISRQIVQAHGGNIRVDSRIGAGSTFTVELPVEFPLKQAEIKRDAV
jgi:PAS domain S-box-containing protein